MNRLRMKLNATWHVLRGHSVMYRIGPSFGERVNVVECEEEAFDPLRVEYAEDEKDGRRIIPAPHEPDEGEA